MQAMRALCVLALLATGFATVLSPVGRVVELLKGLQKTAEKDGKNEEDLYESFVCWGKSVIAQKTASNAAGNSRIDQLVTYLADTAAELERDRSGALGDEISQLSADLEEAKSMRNKENEDFKAAKGEMESATTALGSAISVLGKATKGNEKGVLLAIRSDLNQGAEELEQQQKVLNHAVELGESFLGKADATFLRRLLTGDVPKVDHKKLARKSAFKMKYKSRSFGIQKVLSKMKDTFTSNLKEATTKEKEAKDSYDKLSKTKGDQLYAAKKALTTGKVDKATRDEALAESEEELETLKKQVKADAKFIDQTAKSLAQKKKEYVARQALRTGEIAAISKAIYILTNDDARDLMKKSFSSQEGLFFLQTAQHSSSAANALRSAAQKTGDARLLSLADVVGEATPKSEKTKFKPIIASIDKMIKTLKSEEAEDLKTVEGCEKGRMEDTREAAEASRDMDDDTDAMTALRAQINELGKEIEELEADKASAQDELKSAVAQRAKENKEWQASNADDTAAAQTVNSAKKVLVDFYKDNNLALLQKSSAPVVEAGKAPPPPPDTFGAKYGGKTSESQGIISMLEMVHDDILKDQKKAKADEGEAKAIFDKFKLSTETEIKTLAKTIAKKKALQASRETKHGDTKGERTTKGKKLASVMKKMASINPNCEYFTENYKVRVENRAVEVDGLLKARAILQGGNAFVEKPKAFLQRRPQL